MKKWGALISQTGKELSEICNDLHILPDVILSTKPFDELCEDFKIVALQSEFVYVPIEHSKSPFFLMKYLSECDLITLHGWLRIIPGSVCSRLNIYNGHPGDIVKYPELKGFNPQNKAHNLGMHTSGSVVHKVTAKVDDGPIKYRIITSIKGCDLDTVYNRLRATSLLAWKLFFTEQLPELCERRFAITGAHCTGKTTLVEAIKNFDHEDIYTYIMSMTREAKELGYQINESGNDATQLYILNKHLERLVNTDPCILDRSLIDGYTYTRILYEKGNISNTVMQYAKSLMNVTFMKRYDKIFYLPPTIQLVEDGTRTVEPEFRKHVINIFDTVIQGAGLFIPDLVSVIDGTVEERVTAINKYLKIQTYNINQ